MNACAQRTGAAAFRPSGPTPTGDIAPARASALVVLQRTEALIAEETRALQERRPYDPAAFNNRKSQALLDLSLALRALGPARRDEVLLARLADLRDALEANRRIIDLHLGALREITAVLAEAIRAADSDGTYAPVIATPSARP